ncbi:MAG: putative bifunctional diguanylate cyclase/phosphodiesterase [Xanthobacteraceae bacterium]
MQGFTIPRGQPAPPARGQDREAAEGEHADARAERSDVPASAGSAATAAATEAEIQRLQGLVDELREREGIARQNSELLKEIIDLLPISLTVQDEVGRFVLVNSTAEANFGTSPGAAIGGSPSGFPVDADAAKGGQREIDLLRTGETAAAERKLVGPDGERTWLTSRKSVHVLDRTLLLSTSLDITERKHIEDELVRRAYFDGLTGLPNRALIQEHVEDVLLSKGTDGRLALAFIDLDNFKHINDYYSHAVGDALLIKAAQRIAGRIRATDRFARISGDEFVLLVDPVESEAQLREMVSGVLSELKRPFQIEGFEVFTSASVGVSVYPEHGRDYETLRRNADTAMYRAKSNTKGDAVLFDLTMGRAVTQRMELEQRLRLAIRDHQFCCAFQPKVDIRSQEVVGFETLIRWRDDQGEIQPPSAFVGLATELGLIDSITRFVLAEAIRSMDRLDDAFGAGTTISINVAAKQAGDVKFMHALAEVLRASGRADRIMIELTEDAFVAKSKFQVEVLPILREIGTRVSIDDFGTGYSSLSALADITADEIKVDRSFITDIHQRPRSQSVLRTIESLSEALGMTVIAEGVETFEELAYLQGCTRIRYAQGFYFAEPFFLEDANPARRANLQSRSTEVARGQSERRSVRASRMATGARSRD